MDEEQDAATLMLVDFAEHAPPRVSEGLAFGLVGSTVAHALIVVVMLLPSVHRRAHLAIRGGPGSTHAGGGGGELVLPKVVFQEVAAPDQVEAPSPDAAPQLPTVMRVSFPISTMKHHASDIPVSFAVPASLNVMLPSLRIHSEMPAVQAQVSPAMLRKVAIAPIKTARISEGSIGARRAPRRGARGGHSANVDGNPAPVYPPAAVAARIEGIVRLGLTINPDGRITNVRVVRTSGVDVLDKAAVEAVRDWRAVPATEDGVAVASDETMSVRFELSTAGGTGYFDR